MKNKKICLFINALHNSGGTERIITVLANELTKINYEVHIVTILKNSKPFFHLNEEINLVSLCNYESLTSHWDRLKIILALRKYLQNYEINTVITVDSLLCIYSLPAVLFTDIRHICWEHFNFKIDLGVKIRSLARQLSGLFSDEIVVLSEKDRKYWQENLWLNKSKLQVIYNASQFQITTNDYPVESKNILSVGRLTDQKGFDLLIQAWEEVHNEFPDWTLTIIGSGPNKDSLENLATELSLNTSIKFIAATQNITDYYQNCAFLCLPSRYEGFGLVLIEAMSFGVPAIAFDCDCGPSEILDMDNGILVPNENIKIFAESLRLMISQKVLRINMSNNAKLKANAFTVKRFRDRWNTILKNEKV
ncbi:glycosyltransferase family 4 protein [Enterobacter hormaechei]